MSFFDWPEGTASWGEIPDSVDGTPEQPQQWHGDRIAGAVFAVVASVVVGYFLLVALALLVGGMSY
jgi:hypothetical protein